MSFCCIIKFVYLGLLIGCVHSAAPTTPAPYSDCPSAASTDAFLTHFAPDNPKGVPGMPLSDPLPLATPMPLGPLNLLDATLSGLSELVIHSFHIHAHLFKMHMRVTLPRLEIAGHYDLGLPWTSPSPFSISVWNISVPADMELTVLSDACFFVTDLQMNLAKGGHSVSLGGGNSGMLEMVFDDFLDMLINATKPTVIHVINTGMRSLLLNFLPPGLPSPFLPSTTAPATTPPPSEYGGDYYDYYYGETATEAPEEEGLRLDTRPVRLPTPEEKVANLVEFARFQIPWLVGDPVLLPDVVINIIEIAELHNMSINNLAKITQVQIFSMGFDGSRLTLETRLLHDRVYNRHRVKWFPGSLLERWQWTEAWMGLVKTHTVMHLDRRMASPPELAVFTVRPVVFNPDSSSASTQFMSRVSRRLMDAMKTSFGDKFQALLYSPLRNRLNYVLSTVDARKTIKDFVCYGPKTNASIMYKQRYF